MQNIVNLYHKFLILKGLYSIIRRRKHNKGGLNCVDDFKTLISKLVLKDHIQTSFLKPFLNTCNLLPKNLTLFEHELKYELNHK